MLQGQRTELRVQGFGIRCLRRHLGSAKDVRCAQPLLLPLRDLGGVDAELLSQFRQGFVAFDRGQYHLCFRGPSVILSRSSHCLAPPVPRQ